MLPDFSTIKVCCPHCKGDGHIFLPQEGILKMLLSAVCRETNISIRDLTSRSRKRKFFDARIIYYKLAKMYCPNASTPEISRVVSKHHSTLLSAMKVYNDVKSVRKYVDDCVTKIVNK